MLTGHNGAICYLTPHELTGREPGLRPSGLAQEPTKLPCTKRPICKITVSPTNRTWSV